MTNNPPVNINKNRITFKIKTRYYPELLSPETMSLLGSAKEKKTEDKIVKIYLIYCWKKHLFQINHY